MTNWLGFLADAQWSHLVSALLHTLWQGGLAGLVLFICLRQMSAKWAQLRYGLSLAALGGMVLGWLITWAIIAYEPISISDASKNKVAFTSVQAEATEVFRPDSGGSPIESRIASNQTLNTRWTMWVALTWIAGVAVMLLRAGRLVLGAARIRRQCRPLDDPATLLLVDQLRKAMGLSRRVLVIVGNHVHIPAVLGVIWPAVLLPASVLSGMPVEHLRAILIHELIHIRQYDYLVNFVQLLIEAVLFFNPAVWWVSRQIRIEREARCDALSVAAFGEPIGYAQSLAEWAERIANVSGTWSTVPAFAKGRHSGNLLDRVKRILMTGYRPVPRVSWVGFVGLLLAGMTFSVVLKYGTFAAVIAAAKLISPKERLEKLTIINETHGLGPQREFGENDKITISGTVRIHDGSPLPEGLSVQAVSRRPSHVSGYSMLGCDGKSSQDGKFSQLLEYGIVYLVASAPGYAPTFAPPLETKPGGTISDIELVLQPGFLWQLKVTDPAGKAVQGARLTGRYDLEATAGQMELVTDSTGLATLPQCANKPIALRASASNYQYDRQRFEPKPDTPSTWTLKAARPTSGIIISQMTGKPVPDVKIRLLNEMGPSPSNYSPESAEIITKTDDDGRFALTSLRDDSTYLFVADHDDHRRVLLESKSGQEDLRIELGSPLYIRGKVVGPLEKLKDERGKLRVGYTITRQAGDTGYANGYVAPVRVEGDAGYFGIKNLWAGKVYIVAGDKNLNLTLEDKPIEDLVIDLKSGVSITGEKEVARPVVFRLNVAPGAPPPSGSLRVNYVAEAKLPGGWMDLKVLPIESGEARMDLVVPAKINYDPQGVIGYTFKEEQSVKVPAGDDPYIINIPVIPAGAIYGNILNADGSPALQSHASIVAVKRPQNMPFFPTLHVQRDE